MDHTYVIQESPSKWDFLWSHLWYPVYFFVMYSALLTEWNEFIDQPSFKTGWLLFTFPVLWILMIFLSFRNSIKSTVISIKDNIVQFSLTTGNKSTSAEVVITVIETSGSYHLYSDLRKIFLAKKSIPEDLVQYLNSLTKK
jgi:hypothetical protein